MEENNMTKLKNDKISTVLQIVSNEDLYIAVDILASAISKIYEKINEKEVNISNTYNDFLLSIDDVKKAIRGRRFVLIRDAATLLNRHPITIQRWITKGVFAGLQKDEKGRHLIPSGEVLVLMKELKNKKYGERKNIIAKKRNRA